jgi:hypothetical protein
MTLCVENDVNNLACDPKPNFVVSPRFIKHGVFCYRARKCQTRHPDPRARQQFRHDHKQQNSKICYKLL